MTLWMTLCKLLSGLFALVVRRPVRSARARRPRQSASDAPPRYVNGSILGCHVSEGWYTVGDHVRFHHITGRWFDGVIVQAANQDNLWWIDYRNSEGNMGTTLCYEREFARS